jgi:hypothetical protein
MRLSTSRALDSSSHGHSSSLPSTLLVETVLHVLGEDSAPVLTGLSTTTGNGTLGTVSTADSSSFGRADDFVQQQPIVF